MYEDVLFPTDGETGAEAGFERAVEAATTFDARLHVLHVTEPVPEGVADRTEAVDARRAKGETVVEAFVDRAADRGVDAVGAVRSGEPHAVIVDYAAAEADLVVMPTSGRDGVAQHLLGSTTERVVRTADVPVLTLPAA